MYALGFHEKRSKKAVKRVLEVSLSSRPALQGRTAARYSEKWPKPRQSGTYSAGASPT